MAPPKTSLHIVYVVKALTDGGESRLKHELATLEALGHRVTVISRLRIDSVRLRKVLGKSPARLVQVHEDVRFNLFTVLWAHLCLFLRAPLMYRLQRRAMCSGLHQEKFGRFLHAGVLARALRRTRADHVHFQTENSRIARTAALFANLSYTATGRYRIDPAGRQTNCLVVAGDRAKPDAVELMISVAERLEDTPDASRPRALVVDCPDLLRSPLPFRLREEGFEVEEAWRVGASLDSFLNDAPAVIISGQGQDDGGLRLLTRVRDDVALRQVPFVLVTDDDDRHLRLEALRRGADECLPAAHGVEELVTRAANLMKRRPAGPSRDLGRRRRGMTGQLNDFPLPEIVQVLVTGNRTACVTLTERGRQGRVWFRQGQLVHARSGEATGEEAFFEMLGWANAEFTVEYRAEAQRRTIDREAMFLVFEGLRMRDEEAAAG